MTEVEKTPFPELDIVLKELANNVQLATEDNFVGMYLQGSLAIGDFDMTSDVDFIIVTNDELSDEQLNRLQEIHNRTYDQNNRWVKRLEYSFFPRQLLKIKSSPFIQFIPDKSPERLLWYFNNGSRSIEKSDHCNTLVTRWIVREKGIPIIGPDPKTLIDPIAASDLRNEIKNTLVGWGKILMEDSSPYKNRFYQSYLVLNYARMLHDLHEGSVGSKLSGAEWAKSNLDPKWIDLIDFCWKERQDTSISIKQLANEDVFKRTLDFVKYAVEQGKQYSVN